MKRSRTTPSCTRSAKRRKRSLSSSVDRSVEQHDDGEDSVLEGERGAQDSGSHREANTSLSGIVESLTTPLPRDVTTPLRLDMEMQSSDTRGAIVTTPLPPVGIVGGAPEQSPRTPSPSHTSLHTAKGQSSIASRAPTPFQRVRSLKSSRAVETPTTTPPVKRKAQKRISGAAAQEDTPLRPTRAARASVQMPRSDGKESMSLADSDSEERTAHTTKCEATPHPPPLTPSLKFRALDAGGEPRQRGRQRRQSSTGRRVRFGAIEVIQFTRTVVQDRVPSSGAFAVGLGKVKQTHSFPSLAALHASPLGKEKTRSLMRERDRKKALGLLKPSVARPKGRRGKRGKAKPVLAGEAGREPIKAEEAAPDEVMGLSKTLAEALGDGAAVSDSEFELQDRAELQKLRFSRDNVGCTCKPPPPLTSWTVKKLMELLEENGLELSSEKELCSGGVELPDATSTVNVGRGGRRGRGRGGRGRGRAGRTNPANKKSSKRTKSQIIAEIESFVAEGKLSVRTKCCVDESCPCVANEIPCHAQPSYCLCVPTASKRAPMACANPEGCYLFKPEVVKKHVRDRLREHRC